MVGASWPGRKSFDSPVVIGEFGPGTSTDPTFNLPRLCWHSLASFTSLTKVAWLVMSGLSVEIELEWMGDETKNAYSAQHFHHLN